MTRAGTLCTAIAAAAFAAGLAACSTYTGPVPVVDRSQKPPPSAAASARSATASSSAPAAAAAAPGDGYYVVKKGDTLYSIALENGADYRDVAQWNKLEDPSKIQIGQVLRVTPPAELKAVEVGKPAAAGRIEARPLGEPAPPAAKPAPAPPPAAAKTASGGEFIWPVKGKVLAGFAEPRSKGIDIDGKLGTPVLAAAAGRVTYTGTGIPGLGKLVVIRHDTGFITVYAHNRDIMVKEQQQVGRGQKIAELGATDADRPKLHFQIRKGAAAVDPLRYLPAL
jgi:lipoprotein NlpD